MTHIVEAGHLVDTHDSRTRPMLDRSVLFTDCAGCGGLHGGKRHRICCVAMCAMQHPAQRRIRQWFLTEIPFYKFDCRKCISSCNKKLYPFFAEKIPLPDCKERAQGSGDYKAILFSAASLQLMMRLVQFHTR